MATIPAKTWDANGNLIDTRQVTVDDSAVNLDALRDKLSQKIDQAEANCSPKSVWDAKSQAAQSEITRQAILGIAYIGRLILNRLDSGGLT